MKDWIRWGIRVLLGILFLPIALIVLTLETISWAFDSHRSFEIIESYIDWFDFPEKKERQMTPGKYSPASYGYTYLGDFVIPTKAISKSNHKGSSRYLPTIFKAFEETVAILGRASIGQKKIKEGWVVIQLYFKDRKHIDYSNVFKSALDGLVKGGILQDDKYIHVSMLPTIYGHGDKFTVEVWSK